MKTVSDFFQVVPQDDEGYEYLIRGEGFTLWFNHHLTPTAGVFCSDCRALESETPCEECAATVIQGRSMISANGDRFRGYLESWLIEEAGVNPLVVAIAAHDFQEFVQRAAYHAHEHYARKMGWRRP